MASLSGAGCSHSVVYLIIDPCLIGAAWDLVALPKGSLRDIIEGDD